MKVCKGDKLRIDDNRKGIFFGIATEDFDTEEDEWYGVMLDQEILGGMSTTWVRGDRVPCRRGISKVEVME